MTGSSARRRPNTARRPAPARRSSPSPRLLGLIAAVILVVVAIVFVSCRGSESAADVVSRAFGKGAEIKTAQVKIKIGLTGSASGGAGPLNVGLAGPYEAGENGKASFDFAVDLGTASGAAGGSIGLLGYKGKTYVKIGGQPFTVSNDVVKDLKDDKAKQDSGLSFSSLGISPKSWLQDPKKVGDEQLEGEDVEHIRAGVDVSRLGADLQKLLTRADKAAGSAKQTKQAVEAVNGLKKDIKSAKIDIWAAKGEGALRRMKLDLTLASGGVVIDFGLSRINDDVTIVAPKGAVPLEQLQTLLNQAQAQAGAANGTSGSSGGTGGTSTSTTPDATSAEGSTSGDSAAYTKCKADAAGDITKLQACASLAP